MELVACAILIAVVVYDFVYTISDKKANLHAMFFRTLEIFALFAVLERLSW